MYFHSADKKEQRGLKQPETPKMAKPMKEEETPMESEVLSKCDFDQIIKWIAKLEKGLLGKINNLLKPFTEHLDQLSLNLQQVAKMAEGASAVALAQQEEIKVLQATNENLHELPVILNNRFRFFNLKLRGILEEEEGNTDLISYISGWLSKSLELEEEVTPALLKPIV